MKKISIFKETDPDWDVYFWGVDEDGNRILGTCTGLGNRTENEAIEICIKKCKRGKSFVKVTEIEIDEADSNA